MCPQAVQRTMSPRAVPKREVVGISPSAPISPRTLRCGSSRLFAQTAHVAAELILTDVKVVVMSELSPFSNEPILELRRAPVREALGQALTAMDARLPLEVPVIIGGERE